MRGKKKIIARKSERTARKKGHYCEKFGTLMREKRNYFALMSRSNLVGNRETV